MYQFTAPPKLGIGFTYQPGLQGAIKEIQGLIDFFEVSPDVLCRERICGKESFLDYHPTLLADALSWFAKRPIVVHGLGLSIGSVSGWNPNYLRILETLHGQQPVVWHSEHLGFLLTTDSDGTPLNVGVQLPVPFTEEALNLIVPRARLLCERYSMPFLLENTTYYLQDLLADEGRDEVEFLNDLTERSECGLLLDLYNFYCNAINFGFDPIEALGRLKLDRVVEIHLAGGTVHDGFLMDVHSDTVPEPVWELLDWIIPRTPNLAGIVYELLEQALPIVGVKGIAQQLERAHESWEKREVLGLTPNLKSA